MPKRSLPRIVAVTADKEPLTLRIQWDRADESHVDVSGLVGTFRVYEPLRRSPEMFGGVRVGEHGTDVVWSDEIDMSADTLWRLAQEQSGATMSPDAFRRWRERKAYTLDAAARALGVSRRMVAYYEQGAKPIPRVVALAARALELAGSVSV
jgi:DNA-binding transcriptional regulator YiaG